MLKKVLVLIVMALLVVACGNSKKTKPQDKESEFSLSARLAFFEQQGNDFNTILEKNQEKPALACYSEGVFAISINEYSFISLVLNNKGQRETSNLILYLTLDSVDNWPRNFDSAFLLALLNICNTQKITLIDLQNFFQKIQLNEIIDGDDYDDDNESAAIMYEKAQEINGWQFDLLILDDLSGTLSLEYIVESEVSFSDSDSKMIDLEQAIQDSGYLLAAATYERSYETLLKNAAILSFGFRAKLEGSERYIIEYTDKIKGYDEQLNENYINLLEELAAINASNKIKGKILDLLKDETGTYDYYDEAYLLWRKQTIGEKTETVLEYCLSVELEQWLRVAGTLER